MRSIIFCIIFGFLWGSIESRFEFDIYHDNTHTGGLEGIQTPNQTYDELTVFKSFDLTPYALIKVGKPAKEFKVVFDTTWAHTWLPSAQCAFYEIACSLHTQYDSRKSSTYHKDGTNYTASSKRMSLAGHYSIDDFHLPHLKVKNQTFIEMTHMSVSPFAMQKADGTVGLAFSFLSPGYEPFFYNMYRQKIINDTIFTFYPTRDPTTNQVGRLILGGGDRSRIKSPLTYVPVRVMEYWTILMDKIIFGTNNQTTFCGDGCDTMLDTSTSSIIGPEEVINEMNMLLGAKRINRFYPFQYMVNCNEIPKLPHVTIVLNAKNFTIKPKDYIQRMTYFGFTLCMSPFTPSSENEWRLGNAFLLQFYTEFDISKGRVRIAELIE